MNIFLRREESGEMIEKEEENTNKPKLTILNNCFFFSCSNNFLLLKMFEQINNYLKNNLLYLKK